ncbi:MAG: nicotinate-nucleotide--dimethylbenzimidazole phosphoribosyltransferase, partial [Myxococcota bacterium]
GVFDVGVAEPYTVTPTPSGPTWERMSVGEAGDLRVEDAMTADVFAAAFAAGHRAVATLDADTRVIVLGEMGIGNTTPASAIYAALLGGDPADWVGPGAGLQALETKVQVVRDALSRVGADAPALEVLRRLGGREIAALAGAMVAGAERRMVSLIDGFIVTAAALAVVRHEPKIRDFMVFAHCSEEPGHRRALEALNAEPLLELGLALGEGSGALAAFSLLEQACTLHASMATFETAAVPGPEVP